MLDLEFYRGKRVLVTGHTGFKGTWMCAVLLYAGAAVTGYALEPTALPSIFEMTDMKHKVNSVTGDIRDLVCLKEVFDKVRPEIVIHMAAQPIVRESYRNPVYTYETNVMGTVNVLECIRMCPSVRSFVNVTTDKVYLNREWTWGYRENEELNGYDPYSNSKSCSELVTSCYKNSYFLNGSGDRTVAVSTARAGNVIGGGDFSVDRIIPDCVRAAMERKDIVVRNPFSVRPYQHVLEPVMAYLMIAQKQYEDIKFNGNYNVGPEDTDYYTTGRLVSLFCSKWNHFIGANVNWKNIADESLHEANFLKLDCSRLKITFDWQPIWNVEKAVEKVIEWTVAYQNDQDIFQIMNRQIDEFMNNKSHISSHVAVLNSYPQVNTED